VVGGVVVVGSDVVVGGGRVVVGGGVVVHPGMQSWKLSIKLFCKSCVMEQ
jgi:hypothetical protein